MSKENKIPYITISRLETGEIETIYSPRQGDSAIRVGMALASATRIIAHTFQEILKLPESQREQIEATILEVYKHDLELGDMGENNSFKPVEK